MKQFSGTAIVKAAQLVRYYMEAEYRFETRGATYRRAYAQDLLTAYDEIVEFQTEVGIYFFDQYGSTAATRAAKAFLEA